MITELEEDKRKLLEMLSDASAPLPIPGLTNTQARVLRALMAHDRLSRDALYAISGSNANDGGKIVDVIVCHLRKKIAPLGLTIKNIWGEGYMIPREQREAVKDKLAA